jgi:hypothetical protein
VRTKPCSATITQGRLDKANQFIIAAETIRDIADQDDEVADAYVTLCVHAPATIEEVKKANRAADALVEKARRVRGPAHVR